MFHAVLGAPFSKRGHIRVDARKAKFWTSLDPGINANQLLERCISASAAVASISYLLSTSLQQLAYRAAGLVLV